MDALAKIPCDDCPEAVTFPLKMTVTSPAATGRIRRPGRVDPAALPARWFGKYSMRARAGGHDRRPVELDDAALRQRTVGSRTRGPNFPKSGVRNDQAAIESIQTVISLAGAGGRYRAVTQEYNPAALRDRTVARDGAGR